MVVVCCVLFSCRSWVVSGCLCVNFLLVCCLLWVSGLCCLMLIDMV